MQTATTIYLIIGFLLFATISSGFLSRKNTPIGWNDMATLITLSTLIVLWPLIIAFVFFKAFQRMGER